MNRTYLGYLIYLKWIEGMVLILDGNSEIGAHVRSELYYLICLGHLIRSRAVTNLLRTYLFSLMRAPNVLSYHLILVPWWQDWSGKSNLSTKYPSYLEPSIHTQRKEYTHILYNIMLILSTYLPVFFFSSRAGRFHTISRTNAW